MLTYSKIQSHKIKCLQLQHSIIDMPNVGIRQQGELGPVLAQRIHLLIRGMHINKQTYRCPENHLKRLNLAWPIGLQHNLLILWINLQMSKRIVNLKGVPSQSYLQVHTHIAFFAEKAYFSNYSDLFLVSVYKCMCMYVHVYFLW